MNFWIKKEKCTGCGACCSICPKGAISMQEDETGFKYPVIDNKICINCGLCKKTCPILKDNMNIRKKIPSTYAAWSRDKEIRYNSTSGGIFTEIAKAVIKENGYVIGAKYNDNNLVEHTIINSLDEINIIRQSKYLQSDTKNIYKDAKKLLDNNSLLVFCGSPCQIAGLYNYLKKDYENLITIEFICRGMNSPKAYKSWLSEIEKKEGKHVIRVWFKYKELGWKKSPKCTRIDFEDKSFKVYSGDDNTFMSGYLGPNLYLRPSCGLCNFNGLPRQADITLADFWSIEEKYDDDKGTSLILSNSSKGDIWIKKISNNIYIYKKSITDIEKGNKCFSKSVKINPNSEKFLRELNDSNFSILLEKYSKKGNIKRKMKLIIKKIIKK